MSVSVVVVAAGSGERLGHNRPKAFVDCRGKSLLEHSLHALNELVENLQVAMREAGVPFAAQNRLLAKLAPMSRQVVER